MTKDAAPSAAGEFLIKMGLTALILVAMFIPLWIFLAANAYLDPQTFFEKVAMIGLGYVVLGAAQLWGLFLGVCGIISTWSD